jgi:hypothetical protein
MRSLRILVSGSMILLFLCGANCKKSFLEHWEYIYVKNNSNKSVYCDLQFNFPDTSLHEYGNDGSFGVEINANSKEKFPMPGSWPDAIISGNSASTATFFFISKDTLDWYGWESVRLYYKILERKEMTVTDLENSNWTVNYP